LLCYYHYKHFRDLRDFRKFHFPARQVPSNGRAPTALARRAVRQGRGRAAHRGRRGGGGAAAAGGLVITATRNREGRRGPLNWVNAKLCGNLEKH
jgi:hypothetical protein